MRRAGEGGLSSRGGELAWFAGWGRRTGSAWLWRDDRCVGLGNVGRSRFAELETRTSRRRPRGRTVVAKRLGAVPRLLGLCMAKELLGSLLRPAGLAGHASAGAAWCFFCKDTVMPSRRRRSYKSGCCATHQCQATTLAAPARAVQPSKANTPSIPGRCCATPSCGGAMTHMARRGWTSTSWTVGSSSTRCLAATSSTTWWVGGWVGEGGVGLE